MLETAVHEAGHAVVAVASGIPAYYPAHISIIPNDSTDGYMRCWGMSYNIDTWWSIAILVAGGIATHVAYCDQYLTDEPNPEGNFNDYEMVYNICNDQNLISNIEYKTTKLIDANLDVILQLANELIKVGTMDGSDIFKFFNKLTLKHKYQK